MPAFVAPTGEPDTIIGAIDIVLGVLAALLVLRSLTRSKRSLTNSWRLDRESSSAATPRLSDEDR